MIRKLALVSLGFMAAACGSSESTSNLNKIYTDDAQPGVLKDKQYYSYQTTENGKILWRYICDGGDVLNREGEVAIGCVRNGKMPYANFEKKLVESVQKDLGRDMNTGEWQTLGNLHDILVSDSRALVVLKSDPNPSEFDLFTKNITPIFDQFKEDDQRAPAVSMTALNEKITCTNSRGNDPRVLIVDVENDRYHRPVNYKVTYSKVVNGSTQNRSWSRKTESETFSSVNSVLAELQDSGFQCKKDIRS